MIVNKKREELYKEQRNSHKITVRKHEKRPLRRLRYRL